MKISGLQKLTLSDYPDKLAAIIFTCGCNFKCSYCHNSSLITTNNTLIGEDEVLNYLKLRKKVLDGLVVSGGEPTVQKDLKDFLKKVKEIGYLIKLDTNGSNPDVLYDLLKEKLVDYVAMDVKINFNDYNKITKVDVNINNIKKSIELLKNSSVDYEFRITIIKNYHSIDKILDICEYLGNKNKIYLQNFEDSDGVIDKSLKSFTRDELIEIQRIVKNKFSNVTVRGL